MTVSYPITQKTPAKSKPAIARTRPVTILFWFFFCSLKGKQINFPKPNNQNLAKALKSDKERERKNNLWFLGFASFRWRCWNLGFQPVRSRNPPMRTNSLCFSSPGLRYNERGEHHQRHCAWQSGFVSRTFPVRDFLRVLDPSQRRYQFTLLLFFIFSLSLVLVFVLGLFEFQLGFSLFDSREYIIR